jgi:3-deoxy-D-manno-octulosonic-acid transferase
MYFFYNILYGLVLLCILPYQYFKRPEELRGRWLRERFGFVPSSSHTHRPIWIHAVSVGEVVASIPLLKGLKASYPDSEIVLSTVTDTGQMVAREKAGELARIIYIPFDITFAVAHAYNAIRPSLFIIMETELWPAIIRFFSRHGTPVLLMNGRLSDKSVNGYRKLRFFFEKVLRDISFFCMQDEEYARRIIALGADERNVRAIGNFKFDTSPATIAPQWTRFLSRPVIVAGSTHRSEEALVMDVFVQLLADYPGLTLVVAPRHPERFREVEDLFKKLGISYLKRSEMKDSAASAPNSYGPVIILDVMGELALIYGTADIAIMGGSFIGHGGQNPLEPAFWGKAIICGPHMENFPFIEEFYRNGAAVKTENSNLYGTVKDILGSPELMRSMGKAAKELYEKKSGAAEKALLIIGKYL